MDGDELVNRCKAGDRQALHQLYLQYRPRLLAICMHYAKDGDVAEDLLHDAFIIILTSLDKLRSADKLEPWMARIVRNVGYHYCKHIDQEQAALQQMESEEPVGEETTPMPDYDQLQALVTQLPKGYQQVFRLSVFEGLSHQEISQKLGIAPHTSSSQLSHAKRMLQRLIKQSWMLILLLFIAIPIVWTLLRQTWPTVEPEVAVYEANIDYQTSDSHADNTPSSEPQNEHLSASLQPVSLKSKKDSIDYQTSDSLTEDNTHASGPQNEHSSASLQSGNLKSKKDSLQSKDAPVLHHQPSIRFRSSSTNQSWKVSASVCGPVGRRDDYLAAATIGRGSFDAYSNSKLLATQVFGNWKDYGQYLDANAWMLNDIETRSIMNIASQNAAINEGAMEAHYVHQLPLTIQIKFTRQLNSRLFVETGLNHTQLTSTVTTGSTQAYIQEHQRTNYLGLPFSVGWQWYNKAQFSLYSSGGIMLELPVRSTLDVVHMANGYNTFSKRSSPAIPVQWSAMLSFGIQYDLTPHLGIYMEPSLQYFVSNGSTLRTYRTEHPVSISLPLGIRFHW